MTLNRRRLATHTALAFMAAASLTAPVAHAQDVYPSRLITLVVPYPPGGSNDLFARQVAKELGDELKQTIIVDNRPGASGTTGTGMAARAKPDGYTLVAVSSSMTTNTAIQTNLALDPVKDLAPVAMLAKGPLIVAVNNDFPARTPSELIAAIRAKPGKYNYASSGTGSVNQFATELLKSQVKQMAITHIPYRGMGPAVTELMGGQTQMIVASGPSILGSVKSGKVRAIGVTSLKSSPIAPDLPPIANAVPGYEFELWWGILAPAGTPKPIVAKLNSAINQILARQSIQDSFLREGAIATPVSPEQFGTTIANDVERWKKLAKQQNIVAE